jgi:hypothetical protein
MCSEGHKYGCHELDLWNMHMKHQSDYVVLHNRTGFEKDLTVFDFSMNF